MAGTGQVGGHSLIFTMDAHAKSSVRWPEGQTGSWCATGAQYCLNQEYSFTHSAYSDLRQVAWGMSTGMPGFKRPRPGLKLRALVREDISENRFRVWAFFGFGFFWGCLCLL